MRHFFPFRLLVLLSLLAGSIVQEASSAESTLGVAPGLLSAAMAINDHGQAVG